MAVVLMPGTSPKIIPVRQRTPEWLDARENGIGASQAAAAIGVSPWQSTIGLWAEKLKLVPAQDPSLPMMIGTELEDLVARLYTESTGVKVRRATMLRQHPEHAFMLASLDRRAGRKPIELKYSSRGVGYGEPGTDEVPEDVLVQVLHQLAVVDENEADVAALIPGRDAVQIYTIRRDAEAEAAIIAREVEFWHHVETRTEPPLDGSDATRAYLAARYPRDDGEVLEADDATAAALVALRYARIRLDAWEAVRATNEATIKAFLGTATKLEAPGIGSVTWKATKDSERTDWKAVAAAYDQVIDRVNEWIGGNAEATEADVRALLRDWSAGTIQSLHTETTPGSRRFGPARYEEE